MPDVKIKNRKTVYHSFFDVQEVELQFGEQPEPITRSLVDTHDASGILLHNISSNELVFIKQFRLGAIDHKDKYVIEIPAGVVEKDETPETCARREVLEETGYGIKTIEKIGSFYASPGYSNEKISLFYCTTSSGLKQNPGGGLDGEHEYIQVLEISIKDAMKMLQSGDICDSKTAIALLWLNWKQVK
jgi:nudix-type nucleoside diphosphatase (YffH/AdpP family)